MKALLENVDQFLHNCDACKEAILSLKEGACLVIVIDKRESIAVRRKANDFEVKEELPSNYDALLRLDADAYNQIVANPEISLADLGLLLLKHILMEKVDVEFQSGILTLIRKGYWNLALLAGSPFLTQMSTYGFTQAHKVYAWIESKRK
tara:strand:- start:8283 stop:8732 length:450 start_codon:yes stop_codon:yes gene_type:complete